MLIPVIRYWNINNIVICRMNSDCIYLKKKYPDLIKHRIYSNQLLLNKIDEKCIVLPK